jgi:hypothetical protein
MEVAVLIDFIHSHAGKGLAGVVAAVFLIIWPPSVSWIAAVVLLQWGVRHIVLAFREAERDEQNQAGIMAGVPSLDAPNRERGIAVPRHGAVPARSQFQ